MHRRFFLKAASIAAIGTAASSSAWPAENNAPRVAFGGIGLECSTYSRLRTRLEDFTILRGDALRKDSQFRFLDRYDILFQPTLLASAVPGGPIDPAAYQTIKSEFLNRVKALLPLDGLYLFMHGAMFVAGMEDAEGDWIEATRKVVGPNCIISTSYDLHGSVSQRVIDNLDAFTALRTAPHIDSEENTIRACDMLTYCLKSHVWPTLVWAPIPVLVPGERSSTNDDPAKRLWAQLPELNRQPGVLDVSLLVGYVWADEPRTTASAVVTGTAPAIEEKIAANLAQQYWDARREFSFGTETGSIEECLTKAMQAKTQPAIVADSGDNPTGGGNGDRADLLEALIRRKATGVVFAAIADKPATEACYRAGLGSTLPLSIGFTLDPLAGKPVKTNATVKFLSPVSDPAEREAVVQIEGITLVLSERRRPYHYLADFEKLGIHPTSFKIIVVKSGYLSPELAPIANPSLMALSDGSVNQDIVHLPPNHLRRPSYPFVENLKFTPKVYPSSRSKVRH
jgi:microcystin degradation protein MlrC